ncbi:OLC1v1022028C5 [Oldenlandia corymbosa var. corymbosa]|uniref:OLC1v1022028C5 n=1 Tax=Oldenlandia corymbosa var. corymbosa TaxID=529605 RepID=A0AAV1BXK6_OLDCO|nr:OLC1v1022028C5 [Oldenlandia corymbosa var. corymbosa]
MADEYNSAETEIQPSISRVPSHGGPELSSGRPDECRELVNERSMLSSTHQPMAEHESESPTNARDDVWDKKDLTDEKRFPFEEFTAGLSLDHDAGVAHKGEEDTNRTRIQGETQKCALESPESMFEHNSRTSLAEKQMSRIDDVSSKVTSSSVAVNDNNFLQQQMKKLERHVELLDYEPDGVCQNEVPFFGKMDESKKDDFRSPCKKAVIGKHKKSFYPQVDEVENVSEDSTWAVGLPSDQNQNSDVPSPEEKYFCYDPPLFGETGSWIPVSVPPMSESEHEEWSRGFGLSAGYLPEEDMGWSQMICEDKELTMWDVVLEILLVARGKVSALTSGDFDTVSWISGHLIEQAWKEMSETLTGVSFGNTQEILDAEPPKWLPDSAASACMLCSSRFHPILCTRHHCRFCGGLFCGECSKGRSLLPEKFRLSDPQRVCDVCCVRLESVQPYLMDHVSRAAQLATHDLTDLSTLRSWVNFPWGQSMEYEIYKATNTVRGYSKVGSLTHEKKIPEAILRDAKGLAILTVVKVGMMITYNIGTGLVVARKEDGSWSPPSAISTFGVGWGAQAGGELTDFIIVLRNSDAVRTFSGDTHLSVGAGVSAALGVIGRTAEADLRAGVSSYASCYTYSCSKGAFVGCSLEGSVVTTRKRENSRFYGSQSLTASDILLGTLPRPPAAAILYRALGELYQKL